MLRSMWNGSIQFGMVTVPVKMYAATEDKDVKTHQVHSADNGRINYRKVCSVCSEEVSTADIGRAVDTGAGLVVLDETKLAETSKDQTIEVERFVPPDEIDPVLLDKTYYLAPDKVGGKAYALLREAMSASINVAVTKLTMRGKTRPAIIRVRDDVLVVVTMRWPDEVRAPELDIPKVAVGKQEVQLARHLITAMTGTFTPAEMVDDRREKMLALVESSPVIPHQRTGEPMGGNVLDLMAALNATMAKYTKEGEAVKPTPIRKPRTKKTA